VAEEEFIRGRMKLRFMIQTNYNICILDLYINMNIMLTFFIFLHRQAGKQIRGAISSAYKIEKQAAGTPFCAIMLQFVKPKICIEQKKKTFAVTKLIDLDHDHFLFTGLKDVLKELPTREASRFRTQVSVTCLLALIGRV